MSGAATTPMSRAVRVAAVAVLCLLIAACGSTGKQSDGKYYQDDGPPRFGDGPDPSKVPDAVPRNEPPSRTGNAPYTALGKRYVPMSDGRGYRQTGYASWYGRKYHGRRTSSGETYDMYGMTAAHPTLPLPSYVRVRSLDNGREVVVKVNDRGPFLANRVIDLSYMAARKLGIVAAGTGRVEVETVFAGEPRLPTRVASPAPAPAVPAPVAAVEVTAPVQAATTPAAVTARETAAVAPLPAPGFVLQAGSFASAANASKLLERLRGGGFANVRIQRVAISGRAYHRVQVGPYSDRQSAELIASTLEEYLRSPVSVLTVGAG